MRLFAVKRQHTQGLFAHTHTQMHEVYFLFFGKIKHGFSSRAKMYYSAC